jgi:hypothetical protein
MMPRCKNCKNCKNHVGTGAPARPSRAKLVSDIGTVPEAHQ